MLVQLTQQLTVTPPGRPPAALAPRDALLLAYLALEGPTARVRLASMLWPDTDDESARNSLRQRLFKLRRKLGADLVAGDSVMRLADGVACDLGSDDPAAVTLLAGIEPAEAAGLADWLITQRQRRAARRTDWLAAAAEQAEAEGELAAALEHAQALVDAQPESEHAHRRVMRLHYKRGDRAAALAAYRQCRAALQLGLNAEPSAETEALRQTVERAAPDAALQPVAAPPLAVLRPPQLVGREAERQALRGAVDAAGVVLLFGEAGMGKSRLLDDLLQAPGATGALLTVGSRPGDAAVPYALAGRWLRELLARAGVVPAVAQRTDLARALPELGPAPATARDEDRVRLIAAVEALVGQAVAQGLRAMVIDDLQYADAASVELLQALLGDGRCGWILAMRPNELGAALRTLIDVHSASARVGTLHLPPLAAGQIETLLATLHIDGIGGAAQAGSLCQRTGGNPLYLLETLKAALLQGTGAVVPRGDAGAAAAIAWPRADSVQRLIQQRLFRLSPLALKAARCAAVAGQDLSPTLVAQVLGVRPLDLVDAWAELEATQVLRDGAFAHDLIAEATLASVPAQIAQPLHGEIARHMEQAGGEPVRIAGHWVDGGQPLQAVPHLVRAARRASTAWQQLEAARLHQQAADILRAAGERRSAFDAYFLAAEALSESVVDARLGALREALHALVEDDGQRAMLALVDTALLAERRRFDEARRVVLEALPRAQRAGLPDIEVELLWSLTVLHWERRELTDAVRCAEQALLRLADVDPTTARLGLGSTRLKITHALGVIQGATGRYAQSDMRLQQALQQAHAGRAAGEEVSIANTLAANALEQGALARALAWIEPAVADERAGVYVNTRALALSTHAELLAIQGDLGGALAQSERAAHLCEQDYVRNAVQILRRLHALHFELGRRDLALRGLRALRARDDLPTAERTLIAATLLLAGEAADGGALLEAAAGIEDFPMRVRALCLAQPGCDPMQVLPLLGVSASAAREQGAHGLWLSLQAHRVAALQAAGRVAEAGAIAQATWQRLDAGDCGIEPLPRVAAPLCAALAETDRELAQVIALRASAWMHCAASTLPPGWRENYLERAPIVRILPPAARGLLLAPRRA